MRGAPSEEGRDSGSLLGQGGAIARHSFACRSPGRWRLPCRRGFRRAPSVPAGHRPRRLVLQRLRSQNRDSQSTCAGTRGRALRARRAWRAPWLKGLPGLTKTPRHFSFDVSPAGSSDRCGRLKVVVGSLRPVRSTNHIQGGGNMTGEG